MIGSRLFTKDSVEISFLGKGHPLSWAWGIRVSVIHVMLNILLDPHLYSSSKTVWAHDCPQGLLIILKKSFFQSACRLFWVETMSGSSLTDGLTLKIVLESVPWCRRTSDTRVPRSFFGENTISCFLFCFVFWNLIAWTQSLYSGENKEKRSKAWTKIWEWGFKNLRNLQSMFPG